MSDFHFKNFTIHQSKSALKVGTDSMMLGALIECNSKSKGLDIGAGTGVLSMMVAQRNPDILITAIEIDSHSAQDAEDNFANGPYSKRLTLKNEDFLKSTFNNQFDLIFTNPPFYTDALKTGDIRMNQAKHADSLNSDSLCEKAQELLADNGKFWIIWPFQNRENLIKSAKSNSLFVNQEITLEGNPGNPVRTIFSFSKLKNPSVLEKNIVIRDANGYYTDEYRMLTQEYHNRPV